MFALGNYQGFWSHEFDFLAQFRLGEWNGSPGNGWLVVTPLPLFPSECSFKSFSNVKALKRKGQKTHQLNFELFTEHVDAY